MMISVPPLARAAQRHVRPLTAVSGRPNPIPPATVVLLLYCFVALTKEQLQGELYPFKTELKVCFIVTCEKNSTKAHFKILLFLSFKQL